MTKKVPSKIVVTAGAHESTAAATLGKRSLVGGLALVVVVLVISLIVPSMVSKNKGKASQATKVISQVEKVLLVPDRSDPTVIEVSDVARLKKNNPEFYQNVEQGDYLLMYSDKAVIYRQKQNKIINVAPIVSGKQEK